MPAASFSFGGACVEPMQSHLPLELVDRIVDHLHDSPSDLRNCARVAKAFLPSSRLHLFYSISIDERLHRIVTLNSIIQQSPQVALCIRELCVDGRPGWWKLAPELPTLLTSLTALRHLTMMFIVWTRMPPEVRKAFRTILALPSLVSVTMQFMRFASPRHFTSLLNSPLKRLAVAVRLDDPGNKEMISAIDGEDKIARRPEQQPCRLESLEHLDWYHTGPDFVDWLLGPQSVIDISNIRTLVVSGKATIYVGRLMKSLGPSLEHLTIDMGTSLLYPFQIAYRNFVGTYRHPTGYCCSSWT